MNVNTQPTIVNGNQFFDVSTDNAELDDNGLAYIVDRVGGATDILQLSGCASQIPDGRTCNGNGNGD